MLWENSSKGILMVEKIISSVVFIVWGEGRGERRVGRRRRGRGGGNYAQLSGKYTANAALLLLYTTVLLPAKSNPPPRQIFLPSLMRHAL